MCHGTIEIWDNTLAREWFMEKLLEENTSNPAVFHASIEQYKRELVEVKKYWNMVEPVSQDAFKKYLELLSSALFNFNVWYYTGINNKTPRDIRDVTLELRNEDTFFSSNDVFVTKTLRSMYPEITGYENLVLLDEVFSIPSKDVLIQRAKGAALIDGRELFNGSHEEFAVQYPSYILEHEQVEKGTTSVKGQVAFKGNPAVISGTVRILRRREQVKDVQEGDVIISPMTTPDFLPAMQKAAAFVTDEGGITCHAAIVARELKKPCIIGTKVATQIFKDNDMVEVDADKGVVRIIK